MEKTAKTMQPEQPRYATYFIGYVLSVALTLAAYYLVNRHVQSGHAAFSHHTLLYAVMGLASIQFVVQVFFFLHIGNETKPRWNLFTFMFMLVVLGIIVGGSLWIMNNLNYNMQMTPAQTQQYLHDNEGL